MTLNEIIERKKEEFDREFILYPSNQTKSGLKIDCDPNFAKGFLEKAIRESVEEALREVRPGVGDDSMDWYEEKVEEFMK